ncbi:hypothetical protein BV898_08915 [Hypsibius exemplaris]|uniref:Uncharacterized protein n=1 Tax=Hypsibius exemplaris TaxID=2072580 RepID=A0A1W0WPI5_HYPEX|nr:hypothetical protein BV898_08915 [Hypsibius exemplaris]
MPDRRQRSPVPAKTLQLQGRIFEQDPALIALATPAGQHLDAKSHRLPCTVVANNPSGTCPFISGGTAICSAVGNSSLKCSCQINHKGWHHPRLLAGSALLVHATIGLCCKSSADCGMAPSLMNPDDKPFACLRPLGNEPFGTCGCPVGTQWDAVSLRRGWRRETPQFDIDGQGVCKCKDKFEETGPTPHDRCIPKATTPFAEAECDTNDDCIKLPGTNCRTQTSGASAGKRLCNCKDDFEQDPALIALATPAGPALDAKHYYSFPFNAINRCDVYGQTVGTTPDTFCGGRQATLRDQGLLREVNVSPEMCLRRHTDTANCCGNSHLPRSHRNSMYPSCQQSIRNLPIHIGWYCICSAVGNSSLKCSCQINPTRVAPSRLRRQCTHLCTKLNRQFVL